MKQKRVMIINYGMGNIQSVLNTLMALDCASVVSSLQEELSSADAFILPGIGAFGEGMRNLKNLGLIEPLRKEVFEKKKPLLGICLGMQLMADDSEEEGSSHGLGWVSGHVRKLQAKNGLRVPHMGWNTIRILKERPLFRNMEGDPTFYFAHSYNFLCEEPYVSAWCDYGEGIVSAIQKELIFGVQFHPEKSSHHGLQFLRNFIEILNC